MAAEYLLIPEDGVQPDRWLRVGVNMVIELRADNAALAAQVAELKRDAERYRVGRSVFAHKLCVRADGTSLWRYCEPDPLIGHTFDEAWDAATAAMQEPSRDAT